MKICAAIGSPNELNNIGNAQLAEIRMDVFDKVPTGLSVPIVVTVKDTAQMEAVKSLQINGYLDIGSMKRPDSQNKIISSIHEMQRTPSSKMIADTMNGLNCDLVKGAYMVNRMGDLTSIFDASKQITRPHVLIGMGEMGLITRLRSDMLNNEFQFAHTGTATAPGQLSIKEMDELGDHCMIIGLIGHPINHSSSKKMHTAAMKEAGIKGIYLNFDLTSLSGVETVIKDYDIRGFNVTMPYKKDIMMHLDQADEISNSIGAVNTLVNDNGRIIGTNTDVAGIEFAFERAGVDVKGKRILIMGSGGSARACAYYFTKAGAEVHLVGRNAKAVSEVCSTFGCSAATDPDPSKYDVVVNCTPIGMYSDSVYPIDISKITSGQAVFDLTYGADTPLSTAANKQGCKIVSGLDMLIGQGMRSFELWTGKKPSYDSMRSSIQ